MTPPVKATLRALEAEARAIKRAEFDALPALQQQVASSLHVLMAQRIPRDDLRTIRQRVDDNQSLLQASIRGMHAARMRMAELIQVQHGLSTYDNAGTRTTVPAPKKNIEKKA